MPSPRPAVLLNPLSGRVRRRLGAVRALARAIAGDRYAEASLPGAIADAVAGFDLGEEDILCIVAGDGTLHAALTAMERLRPGGPWPIVAAAPGGTTNMSARDLGPVGRLLAWLDALRRREGSGGRLLARPVLRIAAPGADPVVGLLLGAGAVAEGVDFFNRRLRPLGIPESVGSPVAIARTLLAVAAGGRGVDRMAPPARLWVEGGAEVHAPAIFLAISTLNRVIIGVRPFWGVGGGPIHVTLVERAARGIFRSVPRVILGRPGRGMSPERGWHSHDTARLEVAFDGPYIVDGELYWARAAAGPLAVTAIPGVRWWVP